MKAGTLFPLLAMALLCSCSPAPVSLLVHSRPSGAAVWVDGRPVGETPCRIVLPRDGGLVEVREEGFEPWRLTRGRRDGGQPEERITAELEPTKPRKLHCTSEPPGLDVLVNGTLRGSTPLELGDLSMGTWTVSVQLKSGHVLSRSVHMSDAAHEVETVHFDAVRPMENYYEGVLARNPYSMDAMADLLHLLWRAGRPKAACRTVIRGLEAVNRDTGADGLRFWQEIHRAATGQFAVRSVDSGTHDDPIVLLRSTVISVDPRLEGMSPANAAGWTGVLDILGHRREAVRLAEAAAHRWPEHPDIRKLHREIR